MIEFILLAFDTLLESYSQSLIVVMLGACCYFVFKHGIKLQRTVLQEKKVTTTERNEN